jgi:hypothetical protein
VRALRLVALFAIAACAPSVDDVTPAANAPTPEIFRTVQVTNGTITLGQPLPIAIAPTHTGDTVIALPRGSFGGAERIYVYLTPTGNVRSMVFDYAQSVNFYSMIDENAVTLGAPQRSQPQRQGEEPADLAIWRDARTELRLVRDPNRSAWTVRSELHDLTAGSPR